MSNTVTCLDMGTAFMKCGMAGQNFPTSVFPTMVGRPILRSGEKLGDDIVLKDIMMGKEAAQARKLLEINYPYKAGIVRDWDDMEILWKHAFVDQLQIDPTESKLMLTEPPMNPKPHREKLFETMFEKFGFTHLFIGMQAVLVCYAQGLMTGLVVDSGESTTHTVPVKEATILSNAVKRINCAGSDVTEYLVKLLQRRGYTFNRTADYDTVRQIKERCCYVACDQKLEGTLARDTCVLEQTFELPDEQKVTLGPERFEAPEVLFKPYLVDKEGLGMGEMVWETIQSSPIDVRSDLYKHIVLSGGSTMFPGLPTRIENEIKATYLKKSLKGDKSRLAKFKLNMEDWPIRKNNVFAGAAVLAELMEKQQEDVWVSKAEWQEMGPKAIWAKCPATF